MKDYWQRISLTEKMGNIASEVYRITQYKKEGQKKYAENSFYRTLVMFDSAVNQHKDESGFIKEADLFREVFCDYYWEQGKYNASSEQLMDYLMPFAIQAGHEREREYIQKHKKA